MNDEQLIRYNRHILLPQFGIEAQEKLFESHALIIGLGGLGSPASMYLASAGVGQLTLVDHDEVALSNLQRQIVHRGQDIGKAKVSSASKNLLEINNDIKIATINHKLEPGELADKINQADVVIDATDNFDTRFTINKTCVSLKKPLVSGAAIRFEGQLSVFNANVESCPCYSCLYPENGEIEETCSDRGILAPVVGVIGSLQALEAIKILTGIGRPLYGELLLFDGLLNQWRNLKLKKDPACQVCGNKN